MNNKYYDNKQYINVLIILGIISFMASLFFQIKSNDDLLYGFVLLGLSCFTYSLYIMRRIIYVKPAVVAFIFRFSMCIIYTFQGDGDADYYGVNALIYSKMSLNELFKSIPTGAYLYSWIISFFFRLFGEHYMPVRVFNALLSSVCIVITSEIINYIYKDIRIAIKCAWIMALFPNLIRFSSLFANREVLILFFMLLYLKYSYLYFEDGKVIQLVFSIIYLIPSLILHSSMLAMMVLTILIITKSRNSSNHGGVVVLGKVIIISGTVLAFLYLITSGVGTDKFGLAGSDISIQSVSHIGNMSAEGRAAYLKGVSFSNPILTLLFLPIRMLYFLYTPFPWMVRIMIDFVGLFDAFLYLWVTYYLIRKIKNIIPLKKKCSNQQFVLLLFLALICIVAMFGAVTSNYGTAIRHRCKIFVLFLIITADELKIPFTLKKK